MLSFFTIAGHVILLAGIVPYSPMEWSVLFYGAIFHCLEFLVWYFCTYLIASARWGDSPKPKKLYFFGETLLTAIKNEFLPFFITIFSLIYSIYSQYLKNIKPPNLIKYFI